MSALLSLATLATAGALGAFAGTVVIKTWQYRISQHVFRAAIIELTRLIDQVVREQRWPHPERKEDLIKGVKLAIARLERKGKLDNE